MKINTILETDGGRTESKRFSECHGPSDQLEQYHSPSFETTIRCSASDREEFERKTQIRLNADQLDVPSFKRLAEWFGANCRLKLFGVFAANFPTASHGQK